MYGRPLRSPNTHHPKKSPPPSVGARAAERRGEGLYGRSVLGHHPRLCSMTPVHITGQGLRGRPALLARYLLHAPERPHISLLDRRCHSIIIHQKLKKAPRARKSTLVQRKTLHLCIVHLRMNNQATVFNANRVSVEPLTGIYPGISRPCSGIGLKRAIALDSPAHIAIDQNVMRWPFDLVDEAHRDGTLALRPLPKVKILPERLQRYDLAIEIERQVILAGPYRRQSHPLSQVGPCVARPVRSLHFHFLGSWYLLRRSEQFIEYAVHNAFGVKFHRATIEQHNNSDTLIKQHVEPADKCTDASIVPHTPQPFVSIYPKSQSISRACERIQVHL